MAEFYFYGNEKAKKKKKASDLNNSLQNRKILCFVLLLEWNKKAKKKNYLFILSKHLFGFINNSVLAKLLSQLFKYSQDIK